MTGRINKDIFGLSISKSLAILRRAASYMLIKKMAPFEKMPSLSIFISNNKTAQLVWRYCAKHYL